MDKNFGLNEDMLCIIKKIIENIICFFNLIVIRKIDENHILYLVPKITSKKIKKILNKNQNNKVFFSKELKEYEHYVEKANQNMGIKYYIEDILKYIMEKSNRKLSQENIFVLANNYNNDNLQIINKLIYQVKNLHIVSCNINKYIKLEEKIFEEKRNINNCFK